jgi:hypothetical protein
VDGSISVEKFLQIVKGESSMRFALCFIMHFPDNSKAVDHGIILFFAIEEFSTTS